MNASTSVRVGCFEPLLQAVLTILIVCFPYGKPNLQKIRCCFLEVTLHASTICTIFPSRKTWEIPCVLSVLPNHSIPVPVNVNVAEALAELVRRMERST